MIMKFNFGFSFFFILDFVIVVQPQRFVDRGWNLDVDLLVSFVRREPLATYRDSLLVVHLPGDFWRPVCRADAQEARDAPVSSRLEAELWARRSHGDMASRGGNEFRIALGDHHSG